MARTKVATNFMKAAKKQSTPANIAEPSAQVFHPLLPVPATDIRREATRGGMLRRCRAGSENPPLRSWIAEAVFTGVMLCFTLIASAKDCSTSTQQNGNKEMSYWLHRISHHAEVSHPLMERGYLSIGWSDFSTVDFVEKSRSGDMVYFDSTIRESWGVLPRSRWSLWKYIVQMQPGDLVLVPGWKEFSVYRIVGDQPLVVADLTAEFSEYEINEKGYLIRKVDGKIEEIDLGFFWKVEPVHIGISRNKYADQPLTSRMKIRSTTARLDELKDSVDVAMERFSENKPVNLYSSILDSSQEQILSMIRDDLNPDKFERLVKWYFQRAGASSVVIPPKNEQGKNGDADVIAVFEDIKVIIYVQAKHHKKMTSSWALEQIKDYVSQKEGMDDGYAKVAWVVSSADEYSVESRDAAQQNRVLLIDGMEFSRMLLEAGIANLEEAM